MIALRVFPTAVPIAPEMSCVTLAWPTVVSRSAREANAEDRGECGEAERRVLSGPQEGFGWWAGEPSVVLHESFMSPRFDTLWCKT